METPLRSSVLSFENLPLPPSGACETEASIPPAITSDWRNRDTCCSGKVYRTIEKHTKSKKAMQIVGGDFDAELGLGIGVERVSVGPHALKEGNRKEIG